MIGGTGGHNGDGMHTIGERTFDMQRIDGTVKAGDTEIWELTMYFITAVVERYSIGYGGREGSCDHDLSGV
jgi:hypothetical protein